MNNLRNKVSLIGRLGVKPEVTNFDNGRTLSRFRMATNESYKDKQGVWQENTSWHNVTAWGKTAERMAKSLDKGQEILLEGRLVYQNYETKEGEKRMSTTIEASDFIVLSPKKESK